MEDCDVEKKIQDIYEILQKLTGLHRQLLDTTRMERDALSAADLKGIQDSTYAKEALIEAIRQTEVERMRRVGELALEWKRPVRDLTLSQIAIAIQAQDSKGAEQLRSAFNALTILIQRIREQSDDNKGMIERSLEHVREMKKNVLGETVPAASTYTAQGQKTNSQSSGARLISKEA